MRLAKAVPTEALPIILVAKAALELLDDVIDIEWIEHCLLKIDYFHQAGGTCSNDRCTTTHCLQSGQAEAFVPRGKNETGTLTV